MKRPRRTAPRGLGKGPASFAPSRGKPSTNPRVTCGYEALVGPFSRVAAVLRGTIRFRIPVKRLQRVGRSRLAKRAEGFPNGSRWEWAGLCAEFYEQPLKESFRVLLSLFRRISLKTVILGHFSRGYSLQDGMTGCQGASPPVRARKTSIFDRDPTAPPTASTAISQIGPRWAGRETFHEHRRRTTRWIPLEPQPSIVCAFPAATDVCHGKHGYPEVRPRGHEAPRD